MLALLRFIFHASFRIIFITFAFFALPAPANFIAAPHSLPHSTLLRRWHPRGLVASRWSSGGRCHEFDSMSSLSFLQAPFTPKKLFRTNFRSIFFFPKPKKSALTHTQLPGANEIRKTEAPLLPHPSFRLFLLLHHSLLPSSPSH